MATLSAILPAIRAHPFPRAREELHTIQAITDRRLQSLRAHGSSKRVKPVAKEDLDQACSSAAKSARGVDARQRMLADTVQSSSFINKEGAMLEVERTKLERQCFILDMQVREASDSTNSARASTLVEQTHVVALDANAKDLNRERRAQKKKLKGMDARLEELDKVVGTNSEEAQRKKMVSRDLITSWLEELNFARDETVSSFEKVRGHRELCTALGDQLKDELHTMKNQYMGVRVRHGKLATDLERENGKHDVLVSHKNFLSRRSLSCGETVEDLFFRVGRLRSEAGSLDKDGKEKANIGEDDVHPEEMSTMKMIKFLSDQTDELNDMLEVKVPEADERLKAVTTHYKSAEIHLTRQIESFSWQDQRLRTLSDKQKVLMLTTTQTNQVCLAAMRELGGCVERYDVLAKDAVHLLNGPAPPRKLTAVEVVADKERIQKEARDVHSSPMSRPVWGSAVNPTTEITSSKTEESKPRPKGKEVLNREASVHGLDKDAPEGTGTAGAEHHVVNHVEGLVGETHEGVLDLHGGGVLDLPEVEGGGETNGGQGRGGVEKKKTPKFANVQQQEGDDLEKLVVHTATIADITKAQKELHRRASISEDQSLLLQNLPVKPKWSLATQNQIDDLQAQHKAEVEKNAAWLAKAQESESTIRALDTSVVQLEGIVDNLSRQLYHVSDRLPIWVSNRTDRRVVQKSVTVLDERPMVPPWSLAAVRARSRASGRTGGTGASSRMSRLSEGVLRSGRGTRTSRASSSRAVRTPSSHPPSRGGHGHGQGLGMHGGGGIQMGPDPDHGGVRFDSDFLIHNDIPPAALVHEFPGPAFSQELK